MHPRLSANASAAQAERAGLLRGSAPNSSRGVVGNPDQVRLACQARILGDLVVTVPEETRTDRQIVRKTASVRDIEIRPSIRKYLVELTPPSLGNPKADWDRLCQRTGDLDRTGAGWRGQTFRRHAISQ